jgi:hypothetical protein
VLSELAGRSSETILTGAHLDSWDLGTGALDNGSGTLVVLETARLLAEHVRRTGERPYRRLRFALWMGEELGLYGSRFHVAEASRRGSVDEYRAVKSADRASDNGLNDESAMLLRIRKGTRQPQARTACGANQCLLNPVRALSLVSGVDLRVGDDLL